MMIDTGVNDPEIRTRAFLGRSRALAVLGGVLFTILLNVTTPQLVRASHQQAYPCSTGYPKCHCCSSTPGSPCTGYQNEYNLGCPGGGQCWFVCACMQQFSCCDYKDPQGNFCICNHLVGSCGGGC